MEEAAGCIPSSTLRPSPSLLPSLCFHPPPTSPALLLLCAPSCGARTIVLCGGDGPGGCKQATRLEPDQAHAQARKWDVCAWNSRSWETMGGSFEGGPGGPQRVGAEIHHHIPACRDYHALFIPFPSSPHLRSNVAHSRVNTHSLIDAPGHPIPAIGFAMDHKQVKVRVVLEEGADGRRAANTIHPIQKAVGERQERSTALGDHIRVGEPHKHAPGHFVHALTLDQQPSSSHPVDFICVTAHLMDNACVFPSNPNICICMEFTDKGSFDGIYKKISTIDIDVVVHVAITDFEGLQLVYLYDAHYLVHRGAAYTVTSDVWSLGISLIELALGCFPFSESDHDDSDLSDFEGTLSPANPAPLPAACPKAKADKAKKDKRKSKGVSLQGGAMTMSILELLQHIVNEPAPQLTPEDRSLKEAQDFPCGLLVQGSQ
ncbi:hypothetical protein FIBSPDRAFT_933184 [Athelia psychrophila]|uniref:Protein kinase domain-containing protein n=1 Tax=Athelia psychrophila TaxID=1759441 RepID=A0A166HKX0_9AGAM|nr:hypothetical protein FIBSPDRAFT_933184 [Fibularhizoctonia sp. CBS 109695]